jgi:hypothetical protein
MNRFFDDSLREIFDDVYNFFRRGMAYEAGVGCLSEPGFVGLED